MPTLAEIKACQDKLAKMILIRVEDDEGFGLYEDLADKVGLKRVKPPAHQPGAMADSILGYWSLPDSFKWKFAFASFAQYKSWCRGVEEALAELNARLIILQAEKVKSSPFQAIFHKDCAWKIVELSPLITEEAFAEIYDELTST